MTDVKIHLPSRWINVNCQSRLPVLLFEFLCKIHAFRGKSGFFKEVWYHGLAINHWWYFSWIVYILLIIHQEIHEYKNQWQHLLSKAFECATIYMNCQTIYHRNWVKKPITFSTFGNERDFCWSLFVKVLCIVGLFTIFI